MLNNNHSLTRTELLKQHYIFRSPDSALQSGLEQKPDFTPKGPQVWKGFVSMQDVAKFVTTAYRISGPSDKLVCFIVLGRGCLNSKCSPTSSPSIQNL